MNSVFIFWLIFSFLVGLFASKRGKNFSIYFILALLLSPIIGFLIAMLTDSNEKEIESKRLQSGTAKKCPFCAELIKIDAIKCKYCGSDVGNFGANSLAFNDDLEAHKALQDAIYKKDEDRVKAILDTSLPVSDSPLAFGHKEYAELHGTPKIVDLIDSKSE